jgi:hypothetical protein
MAKLVWRVKLVADLEPGVTTEVEVARLEREEQAGLADLGLRLAEAKQLTAALQAEMVPAQVTMVGERRHSCEACGGVLAGKGHYGATFRSLFGDVPVRVRRLLTCSCQGSDEAKSFAVFDLKAATVAPELAYVTARYAALAPFGKVADLLSELLPISGARNAGTVRNQTLRVGEAVVPPASTMTVQQTTPQRVEPVVVGLDGGYVRSRHRQEERHFEVVAGKVINANGRQSRFAFARNSPAIAADVFKPALAAAGVSADTPATVLCDGDGGLWRLQRGAAGGYGRARLVACRGALRACAASGPRPRRRRGRHAAGRRGGSRTGTCEVALVTRPLAGMPAQACGPASLDAARADARRSRYRASRAARQ